MEQIFCCMFVIKEVCNDEGNKMKTTYLHELLKFTGKYFHYAFFGNRLHMKFIKVEQKYKVYYSLNIY